MSSHRGTFGPIALSLSGGGYRAASFHLGTLEMLNELDLLEDVKYLSTVSGGSIVGVFYAASAGMPFADFKRSFEDFLKNNAVKLGLENLRSEPFVTEGGQMPTVIRAAACVYDTKLFNGKTLGSIAANPGHLSELVINTTEMRDSRSFRFVYSRNTGVESGNNYLQIDDDTALSVRLADAVAASSCFPGGFEPIRFPSDFTWPQGVTSDEVKGTLGPEFFCDVPLMDGGIFDNQGIESIKNILKRKKHDIGVYIISDTSPRATGFKFVPETNRGFVPLVVWRWLIGLFGVLTLASAFLIATQTGPVEALRFGWWQGVLTYYLPLAVLLALGLGIAFGLWKIRSLIRLGKEKTGIDVWSYLRHLTIAQTYSLLTSRIKSVLELTTSTFMARIRLMGFRQMFENPETRELLLPNLIYDIDKEGEWNKKIAADRILRPRAAIRLKVKQAEAYGTNLWFFGDEERNNLIECGRATIVFKLIDYLIEYRSAQINDSTSREAALYKDLVKKWQERFNK